MKRAAIAGFSAGAAMMIGCAHGAGSGNDPKPVTEGDAAIMYPMIGSQAMLPDRDIMNNITASPMHGRLVAALK
jgi:hypothetical protein